MTRDSNRNGVFGAKISPKQAEINFGSVDHLLECFRDSALIWLIREDIVAQAVSLYLMRFRDNHHKTPGVDISFSKPPE
jgi:LPS sulfotransferase NodH